MRLIREFTVFCRKILWTGSKFIDDAAECPPIFKQWIQENSRRKNLNSVSSVNSVAKNVLMRLLGLARADCWKRGRERV